MKKDQFLELLGKKLTNDISASELKLLNVAMVENEDYQKLAQTFHRYFNQKQGKKSKTAKLKDAWATIAKAEQENFKPNFNYSDPKISRFTIGTLPKIAAILIVMAIFAFMTWRVVKNDTPTWVTITAGQQKSFKLMDDGSKIWLNKHSFISYNENFGQQHREITLHGEAYFEVAKNAKVPLSIHVGPIDIEVKGTAFNVNAYGKNDSIEIALVRGLIQVSNKLEGVQKVLLRPNQKLVAANSGKGSFSILPIHSIALNNEMKWTVDTLVFRKEKLKDLVPQLEKKYNLKIEIRSTTLQEKRFSGTFTDENIQQVLEALKLSYPLTYLINDKLVVIKD
ncbi:MAG: FecR family protein [Pedobacter sp.]|nr:FecR family protein [Pedobacter sp.]MDQ8054542.1 FecR family protein [Pedobacter sp.]